MKLSMSGNRLAVQTPFSKTHNLLQIFSNIGGGYRYANNPVEFHLAALQRTEQTDIWHPDVLLAYATDEAAPVWINGGDIGGNHGCECVVEVTAAHDKTCADIGSLWKDDAGLDWTLLRVVDGERLWFLSENTGASKTEYAFASAVSGKLTYASCGAHPSPVVPERQQGGRALTSSNRHLRTDVFYVRDGRRLPYTGDVTCDSAEIVEEYEIVNPATVAEALRRRRPADGYDAPQTLAVGEGMFLYRMTLRIAGDGTVLCDFDHRLLQEVRWSSLLGIMYQVRCDTENGGVWRYIPKLLPLTEDGVTYDFSAPYNTSGEPFPKRAPMLRSRWLDPESPPDRQICFIRARGGTHFEDADCIAAFAGGYLPLYDGAPEVRRRNIGAAGTIVGSRKTYPTFLGSEPGEQPERRSFTSARGVGFRKFFLPESRTHSWYTIPCGETEYLYADFWGGAEEEISYPLPDGRKAEMLECYGLTWEAGDGVLKIRGSRGTAVFALTRG